MGEFMWESTSLRVTCTVFAEVASPGCSKWRVTDPYRAMVYSGAGQPRPGFKFQNPLWSLSLQRGPQPGRFSTQLTSTLTTNPTGMGLTGP